jgi:hypothetical protein
MKSRILVLTAVVMPSLFFSACGGSSGSTGTTGGTMPPPPLTYTIGVMVSGLSGRGLVLQDNGGDNLSVTANGSFTFATSIAGGGAYSVAVLTQPSSPAQTCAVTNGNGTANANVTSVKVTCTTVVS